MESPNPNEIFDFSRTPDTMLLPEMFYNFEITKTEIKHAASNKTLCSTCGTEMGKKMIVVEFTVLEPNDYAGSTVMENFTIGTEADPCVHQPATLMQKIAGAVYFKQLLHVVGLGDNEMNKLPGRRCQRAVIIKEIDAFGGGKRNVNNFAPGQSGMIGAYPVNTVAPGLTLQNRAPGGGIKPLNGQKPQAPQVQTGPMNCPRCKESFTSGEALDDHMAERKCVGVK